MNTTIQETLSAGVRIPPAPLQEKRGEINGWEVDPTPNAIQRHFPQPSFTASADFAQKITPVVEKSGRPCFFQGDATGVTVGNAPSTGVTEADLDLAKALNQLS